MALTRFSSQVSGSASLLTRSASVLTQFSSALTRFSSGKTSFAPEAGPLFRRSDRLCIAAFALCTGAGWELIGVAAARLVAPDAHLTCAALMIFHGRGSF